MRVGVLALQGNVERHRTVLSSLGAEPVEVRTPRDLEAVEALVLPGGESTTMSMLLESSGLWPSLRTAVKDGMPMLGTCAGMILLADRISDGRPDQQSLGALDIAVKRNGFGRQAQSFECDLTLDVASSVSGERWDAAGSNAVSEAGSGTGPDRSPGSATTVRAVFIRAPLVEEVGPAVEVLARLPEGYGPNAGSPVLCRQGAVLVSSFHPELSGETAVHRLLVGSADVGRR
ncbi:MAG: pyridoxal 5'-phosphate synthase glutaminase subunit PdxT [Actinomycetota bacterium]|nr:pyridoxal 5'-phosphate synthase glutaminase subunit PdxT [Actinomycetota bacterium]